ncbi:MAG: hypothetical protein Ta2D_04210 [Rickettsiales bacterium]|nr:MAG: hypothetical protein Ta2D_04210 [Rickettsiales bacterium]
MFKSFIYSILFHLIILSFLFLSLLISIKPKQSLPRITPDEISMNTINIINEKMLKTLTPSNNTMNDKIKNMSISEKLALYKKIKDRNSITETLKKFRESGGASIKAESISIPNNKQEENVFSYYYIPVYIAENKLTEQEKDILIKDHNAKEEIRQLMRDYKLVPEFKKENIYNFKNLDEAVKIAQQPIQMEQKKVTNSDIDDEFKNINENEIFSKEDIKKMEEMLDKDSNTISLSVREMQNIQQQIKNCYKRAIVKNKKDNKTIITLTIHIDKNGMIGLNDYIINDSIEKQIEEGYKIALENAKTALIYCNPLRNMPLSKYDLWKTMTLTFDSTMLD